MYCSSKLQSRPNINPIYKPYVFNIYKYFHLPSTIVGSAWKSIEIKSLHIYKYNSVIILTVVFWTLYTISIAIIVLGFFKYSLTNKYKVSSLKIRLNWNL